MTTRYCPSCQAKLPLSDYYFCSTCTAELPISLQLIPPHQQRVISYEQNYYSPRNVHKHAFEVVKQVAKNLNLKEVVILVLIAAAVGIPLYLWMTKMDIFLQKTQTLNTIPVEQTLAKKFQPTFSTYFPYIVDLYYQNVPEGFAFFTYSTEVVENETIRTEVHWGMAVEDTELFSKIVAMKDPEVIKSDIFEKVEEVYLFADSKDTLTSMINARTKLVKNLGLNPEFVLFKSGLDDKQELYTVFAVKPINYMKTFEYAKLPKKQGEILQRFMEKQQEHK